MGEGANILVGDAAPSRPVLRYFGGKWMLAPWILSHFPEHRIYCEPFGGGASVLMRKPRSHAEVYNDLDGYVVNVFRVLRDPIQAAALRRSLELTPFAREEFESADYKAACPVEMARATIIRSIMGFGTNSQNPERATGFRANANRSHTTPAHDWVSYPAQIPLFVERLRGVVIENRDAKECMAQQDSAETLHFVDPPYVHSVRGCVEGYRFEMSDEQHVELCDFLKSLKGMVVLCGYENPIYQRLGWKMVSRAAYADGARERTECLWLNPQAAAAQGQMELGL